MSGMYEFTVYQCPKCGGLLGCYSQGLVLDGRLERRYYAFLYGCDSCAYSCEVPSTPETDPNYAEHQAEVNAFRKNYPPPFPGK